MITAYNAVSEDGFIARANGEEDFIPDEAWEIFLELCNAYPATITGGTTYLTLKSYPKEEFERYLETSAKKIIVTRDQTFNADGFTIAHSPQEAVSLAPDALLCTGPTLNTAFLDAGLIDRVLINQIPTTIGSGIRQFNCDITSFFVEVPAESIHKNFHLFVSKR